MTDQAFATLTTNDAYTKAVLHRTTKRLVVLATPQVSDSMRKVLETVFAEVIMVDVLDELAITLTKLHCWLLIQYSKCVSMDADTLVLGNIDDLFEREEISAGPDPRWPDYFNSEVFIYQPSQGSFDGGDQGLLNTFFFVFSLLFFLRLSLTLWATIDIRKHFISIYSHLPAFKVFVVHFLYRSNHGIIFMIPKQKVSKMSQGPCHICPLGRSHLLYPQKNGRSAGNRARLIIWEGNLTLTSSRNTAFSCGRIHFTSLVSNTKYIELG
uniref:Glycogenin 1 n=1 Tax=Cercocebus atys TaxID=9531 RepID=A0A2K5LXJ1_CERAT